MRRKLFFSLMALSSFFCAELALAQTTNFKLDPTHTAVVFSISHIGLSYTYGRFNSIDGTVRFNANDLPGSSFTFSMDANSIDTGNSKRDEHLKGPDFFNVKQFPSIEFTSSKIEKTDKGISVTGKLTMHGETKEITIPFEVVGPKDSPFGDVRMGLSTQFRLKRSDFGMNEMLQGIGDEVAIYFSFEAVRQ